MSKDSDDEPHPVDIYVGEQLRLLRSNAGVSQTTLAESAGVSFQQIQKYERGKNRVSASRLYEMAQVLAVPVAAFFPDEQGTEAVPQRDDPAFAQWAALYRAASDERRTLMLKVVNVLAKGDNPHE